MENTDNSYKTAIKRNKVSAPMRYLAENGLLTGELLDFGCGRGDDAERLSMDKYDPFYAPSVPKKQYDTITCNYVLNVIEFSISRYETLRRIEKLLKDDGTAYITVRRDKFEEGRTSKGTYQTYVTLDLPVLIEKKGSFITYILKKSS